MGCIGLCRPRIGLLGMFLRLEDIKAERINIDRVAVRTWGLHEAAPLPHLLYIEAGDMMAPGQDPA